MANSNRDKGHRFEREIAKKFRELGFNCTTSRYSSKEKDDAKIDLCGTEPFNVQLKAVERLGSYHKVLASLPQENGLYRLLMHKKSREGTIVAMELETFLELLQKMIEANIIYAHNNKINPR